MQTQRTGRRAGRATAEPMVERREAAAHVNEVRVVGRLASDPASRLLPSGDELVVWRLVVERAGPPVTGRPHLDTLECVAWSARLRRVALAWSPGDVVEVTGALRRRFWRSGAGINSRYEIEALTARRVSRG